MKKPEPCHGGCDHTDLEHYAFDRGMRDGQVGKGEETNPYRRSRLAEAWRNGHDYGAFDYAEEQKSEG